VQGYNTPHAAACNRIIASRGPLLSARHYAEFGFQVFPVSQSKAPLTRHGLRDATRDPRQIAQWIQRYPSANIGLLCSWFWVLDYDSRHDPDGTIDQWITDRGTLPATWRAETPGGGWHLFFKHDPQLEMVPLGKFTPFLDVKGNCNHYVLGAPSVNSKGIAYRWTISPRNTELAEAPRWLIDLIVETKRLPPAVPVDLSRYTDSDRRIERARRYARLLEPAISGSGGHSATFAAAQKIARGFALSEDEAFAVLATEYNPRCQPPWGERELKRKVAEAMRYGSMAVGYLLDHRKAS
jgi:hypothetical protein